MISFPLRDIAAIAACCRREIKFSLRLSFRRKDSLSAPSRRIYFQRDFREHWSDTFEQSLLATLKIPIEECQHIRIGNGKRPGGSNGSIIAFGRNEMRVAEHTMLRAFDDDQIHA